MTPRSSLTRSSPVQCSSQTQGRDTRRLWVNHAERLLQLPRSNHNQLLRHILARCSRTRWRSTQAIGRLRQGLLAVRTVSGGSPNNQNLGGESWYDQLVDGDLNVLIALISAIMIIMGAALIIRPRDRAAPQPWRWEQWRSRWKRADQRGHGNHRRRRISNSFLTISISDFQGKPRKRRSRPDRGHR